MQNLPRLLFAPFVDQPPLKIGEQTDRLLCDARVIGESLQRRNNAVSAEQCDEPGHAGGEVTRLSETAAQRPQVAQRTIHDAVEQQTVAGDLRFLPQPGRALRTQREFYRGEIDLRTR